MPKFACMIFNHFDNDSKMAVLEAPTREDAMLSTLIQNDYGLSEDEPAITYEEIKQFAFNCDAMVDAIEVHPDTQVTKWPKTKEHETSGELEPTDWAAELNQQTEHKPD